MEAGQASGARRLENPNPPPPTRLLLSSVAADQLLECLSVPWFPVREMKTIIVASWVVEIN